MSGWYIPLFQRFFPHPMQWYLLKLSQLMYQFLVDMCKCFKLFFPCKAMVSSNITPINGNFVTIHETGITSAKIINKFIGKKSLKHISSIHFPLITAIKEDFHIYSLLHSIFQNSSFKKACFVHCKGKNWWICNNGSASLKLLGLFFENRVISWVSINHPKSILKELLNVQLWFPTTFQHKKALFHSLFRIICSLCSTGCLIKDRVFKRWKNNSLA